MGVGEGGSCSTSYGDGSRTHSSRENACAPFENHGAVAQGRTGFQFSLEIRAMPGDFRVIVGGGFDPGPDRAVFRQLSLALGCGLRGGQAHRRRRSTFRSRIARKFFSAQPRGRQGSRACQHDLRMIDQILHRFADAHSRRFPWAASAPREIPPGDWPPDCAGVNHGTGARRSADRFERVVNGRFSARMAPASFSSA